MPRSTVTSRMKLETKSPAPTTSMTASATSATTRAERTRCFIRPPVADRPPSRSDACRFGRDNCSAGITPQRRPVTTAAIAATRRTRKSRPTVASRGRSSGIEARSTLTPHSAMSSATASPAIDNTRLSTNKLRAMRHRLAPRAARTDISLDRFAALTSIRLATLAQAIRRTQPTAPRSNTIQFRVRPTVASCSGAAAQVLSSNQSGYFASRADVILSISRRTCSIVVPSFRRPTTRKLYVRPVWFRSRMRSLAVGA